MYNNVDIPETVGHARSYEEIDLLSYLTLWLALFSPLHTQNLGIHENQLTPILHLQRGSLISRMLKNEDYFYFKISQNLFILM